MPEKVIHQQPVKKTDLVNVSLYLSASGAKTWGATYLPKDELGNPVGTEPRVMGTQPVTTDPGLWAWVDNVVVVAINAQEGT